MKSARRVLLGALALLFVFASSSLAAFADALSLPEDLTIIEAEAFSGDKSITAVELPEGVREIWDGAFANSSLKEINLPDSLTYIADDAFEGVRQLGVRANHGSYAYTWGVENGLVTDLDSADTLVFRNITTGATLEMLTDNDWTPANGDIAISPASDAVARFASPGAGLSFRVLLTDEYPAAFAEDTVESDKGDILFFGDLSDQALDQAYVNGTSLFSIPADRLANARYAVVMVAAYASRLPYDDPVLYTGFTIVNTAYTVPAEWIEEPEGEMFLAYGDTLDLKDYCTVYPEGAALPDMTWTSDDPDIVCVDADGVVTAADFGFASVSGEASDGSNIFVEFTFEVGFAAPKLLTPRLENGVQVTLQWEPVPGAAEYKVLIATDADFEHIVRDDDVADTHWTVYGLDENTTYYYEVYATLDADSLGHNGTISVSSFRTGTIVTP